MNPEQQKQFDQWTDLLCWHWQRFYRLESRLETQECLDAYHAGFTPAVAAEKIFWDRKGTAPENRPRHRYSGAARIY